MSRKVKLVGLLLALALGVAIGMTLTYTTNNFSHAIAEENTSSTIVKLEDVESAFVEIAERALPAVVHISATIKESASIPFEDDFFKRFFGEPFPFHREGRSLGSGFIFKRKGNTYYVMTNNHVIKNSKDITITLNDGTTIDEVKVVGRDPRTDIAVLSFKYDGELPVLKLGDSDKVKVGQWAIAIGSPFGLSSTVTVGVISSLHRRNVALPEGPDYQDFLQTDAAINPGNSGGPLLNIKGEVIGVNTAIATTSGSFAGIGFAVPINLAKDVAEQLIKYGRIERGYLGVMIQRITPELAEAMGLDKPHGALVTKVLEGYAAEKYGIKEGDIIVEVDGRKIKDIEDLRLYIGSKKPGDVVKIKVIRNGKEKIIKVKLSRMPDELAMAGETPEITLEYDGLGMRVAYEDGKVVIKQLDDRNKRQGLREGDVLIRIGDIDIETLEDFERAVEKYEGSKKPVLVVVERNGNKIYLALKRR